MSTSQDDDSRFARNLSMADVDKIIERLFDESDPFGPFPDISAIKVKRLETILVPSSSEPNKTYTVTRDDDGFLSCECKGYEYRSKCRHIKAARAYLMIRDSQPKQ